MPAGQGPGKAQDKFRRGLPIAGTSGLRVAAMEQFLRYRGPSADLNDRLTCDLAVEEAPDHRRRVMPVDAALRRHSSRAFSDVAASLDMP